MARGKNRELSNPDTILYGRNRYLPATKQGNNHRQRKLGPVQAKILTFLTDHENQHEQMEAVWAMNYTRTSLIAAATSSSTSEIERVLTALEKRNLVVHVHIDQLKDRRKHWKLTDNGRELVMQHEEEIIDSVQYEEEIIERELWLTKSSAS